MLNLQKTLEFLDTCNKTMMQELAETYVLTCELAGVLHMHLLKVCSEDHMVDVLLDEVRRIAVENGQGMAADAMWIREEMEDDDSDE